MAKSFETEMLDLINKVRKVRNIKDPKKARARLRALGDRGLKVMDKELNKGKKRKS
jgi:hypothetical protein